MPLEGPPINPIAILLLFSSLPTAALPIPQLDGGSLPCVAAPRTAPASRAVVRGIVQAGVSVPRVASRGAMAFACASHVRRLLLHPGAGSPARSFYAQPYQAKVGVVEFLNGVGKGVETHAAKLEEAVGGDLQRLLETRTLRLKKLGVPCKHRKLILSFAHKYRLGLWKPRAEARKVQ